MFNTTVKYYNVTALSQGKEKGKSNGQCYHFFIILYISRNYVLFAMGTHKSGFYLKYETTT